MNHSNSASPDSQDGSVSSNPNLSNTRNINVPSINGKPLTITMEIYENQRWFPLSKWSSTRRLPSDRPLFSNKIGTEERDLATYEPPLGYVWGSLPNTPSPSQHTEKLGAASKVKSPDDKSIKTSPFDEADDYMYDIKAARANNKQADTPTNTNPATAHTTKTSPSAAPMPEIIANSWQLEIKPERTDKDGWRYAVDYKANFGKEMTATSLVRRRKYFRSAVYVGGTGLNVDTKNSVSTTVTPSKVPSNDLQFQSGGIGAAHLGDSFVFVSNTGGAIKTTTGHGDDDEKGFESCESEGGTLHKRQKGVKKNTDASQSLSDASPLSAEDEAPKKNTEVEKTQFTSAEAQRQAAVAALASMRTKQEKLEEATYLPRDNDCAKAWAEGEGFDLPASFQKSGANTHQYTNFNSTGHLSTEPTRQFSFTVPDGPYMAVSSANNSNRPSESNRFSTKSATFVVTPPPRLPDDDPQVLGSTLSNSAYFGASAGSSPARTQQQKGENNEEGGSGEPTVYFGAAAGSTVTASAADFDEVFRAFVAKEQAKTTL